MTTTRLSALTPAGADAALQAFWWPVSGPVGTAVPAHGLVRPTARGDENIYTIVRPTADGQYVWIAGPFEIPAGGNGCATAEGPVEALYDSADGTPAVGETWGAGASSFKLRKNKAGFLIVGTADTDRTVVPVVRECGAGGAYDPTPDPTQETTETPVTAVVYEMRDGRPTIAVTTTPYTTTRNADGQVLTRTAGTPTTTAQDIDPCLFTECCDDAALAVTATATPDHGMVSLTVAFAVTVTGSHTYLWDFRDGSTSTTEDPSHTFTETGLYLVTVKVDNCREEIVPVAVGPTDCSCPSCDLDESNEAPARRKFTFEDAAGAYADLNGDWVLERTDVCEWSWWRDDWLVVQSYDPDTGALIVNASNDVNGYYAQWESTGGATDCCTPIDDFELVTAIGPFPGDALPTFTVDGLYPVNELEELVTDCESCTVTVGCCAEPIRRRLLLSFTGAMSAVGTVELVYDAAGSAGAGWYGSAAACGGTVAFEFLCTMAGSFNLNCLSSGGATAFFLIGNPATTCDPFAWTANYIDGNAGSCGAGGGAASVVEL